MLSDIRDISQAEAVPIRLAAVRGRVIDAVEEVFLSAGLAALAEALVLLFPSQQFGTPLPEMYGFVAHCFYLWPRI